MSDEGVKIIDHNYLRYRKALKALNGSYIRFGFFAGSNVGFAKIMHSNEFGDVRKMSRKQRGYLKRIGVVSGDSIIIPERSFVRSTFDEGIDRIQKLCIKTFQGIEEGREKTAALKELGKSCADMVRKKLDSGDFLPNDPFTREQKGMNKKPLEDRGALMDGIDHVVVTN
ncbi:MAG: hypothetical protein PQJ58_15180 [Spirochaetales bacterium]|nr:hypothetical protein [Spirochaetales bacterium]